MPTGDINKRDILQVKDLKNEAMKAYIVPISATDSRPKYIYECISTTPDEGDCMVTIYVYEGDTSKVLYSVERKAKWDGQWDLDAETAAQLASTPYSIEDYNK